MVSRSKYILSAALLLVTAVAAAARDDTVPQIDLQKRCRASAKVAIEIMGDASAELKAFDACMKSETDARNAILAAWKDMPQSYKTFCVRPKVYSPSYVEWIACLEMQMDVKRLRAKQ